MKRQALVACAVIAGLAVAGCGGSSSSTGSTESTAATAPASATPTTSTAPTSGETSTGAAIKPPTPEKSGSIAFERLPVYEPSTIVESTPRYRFEMDTAAPVSKVTSFYSSSLPPTGWTVVSKTVTPTKVSYAVKGNQRTATVTISASGAGSHIVLHTTPAT